MMGCIREIQIHHDRAAGRPSLRKRSRLKCRKRKISRGFDGFTVVLDSDGKQQLIYKHAISTVVPPKPLDFERDT